ncbi:hypothetical protein DOE73_20390 [Paenibacillus dendritiformis]|nr:hypothetical protein DOE73_20390 [Paenibacillus dendritiformis]
MAWANFGSCPIFAQNLHIAYMVNCTTFHRQDGPVKDEKFGDRASFRYNRAMDAEVELDIHT